MVSKTRFKSSPSSSSSSFDKPVEFTRLLFYVLGFFLTSVWASACDYKYCHLWLTKKKKKEKRYRINCQPENSIQTWEWYGGGYLSQPLQGSCLNNKNVLNIGQMLSAVYSVFPSSLHEADFRASHLFFSLIQFAITVWHSFLFIKIRVYCDY